MEEEAAGARPLWPLQGDGEDGRGETPLPAAVPRGDRWREAADVRPGGDPARRGSRSGSWGGGPGRYRCRVTVEQPARGTVAQEVGRGWAKWLRGFPGPSPPHRLTGAATREFVEVFRAHGLEVRADYNF